MKIFLNVQSDISYKIRIVYSYEKLLLVDDGFWSFLICNRGYLFFRGSKTDKWFEIAKNIAKRLQIPEENVR